MLKYLPNLLSTESERRGEVMRPPGWLAYDTGAVIENVGRSVTPPGRGMRRVYEKTRSSERTVESPWSMTNDG